MKKYSVMIPFAGHFCVEVEADDKEQAQELAFEANPFDENSDAEIMAVEYYEQMTQGNVAYCTLSEVDVEEIK